MVQRFLEDGRDLLRDGGFEFPEFILKVLDVFFSI
jgi:hypothetical protein